MRPLAYAFAKKHGVVLLEEGEAPRVGLREGADPMALIEARRALRAPIRVETLPRAEFEKRLSEVYAGEGLSDPGADFDMGEGLEIGRAHV